MLEVLLGAGFIVLILLFVCDIFYPPYKKLHLTNLLKCGIRNQSTKEDYGK